MIQQSQIIINLPYQNHINKKIMDYFQTCCNQQNNVNFAEYLDDVEAKEDNYIYFCIIENKFYLFVSLSSKKDEDKYLPLIEIWSDLNDVTFTIEDNKDNLDSILIYKFNIKKFYSVLSFSSDYKSRDNVTLCLEQDYQQIYYKISDTISVDIAEKVNNRLRDRIIDSFKKKEYNKTSLVDVMSVKNVDKNSFLLPYFNHKDCLNFTVASFNDNRSVLQRYNNELYLCNVLTKDNKVNYLSLALLRKDKFNSFNIDTNYVDVSPGLWQLLVILQGNKQWNNLNVYITHADLCFGDNIIYHGFDKKAVYKEGYLNINFNSFNFVGELFADEIFLLNKLFPNSKSGYFDFSSQKFIGDSYLFCDDKKDQTVKTVDLKNNEIKGKLPLTISFTELKHYIGGDLSQKEFILDIYTDGISVMLIKLDKDRKNIENIVIFNQVMSKQYLGL